MIIKVSKQDREYLEEQLLKLLEENKSDLSNATDEEVRSGIATFAHYFSLNNALFKRAIETIREIVNQNAFDREHYQFAYQRDYEDFMEQEEKEQKVDSLGPELLESFGNHGLPF